MGSAQIRTVGGMAGLNLTVASGVAINSISAINPQSTTKNGTVRSARIEARSTSLSSRQDAIDQINTMISEVAASHPSLTIRPGVEVSSIGTHLNWFGDGATLVPIIEGNIAGAVAAI